MNTKTIELIEPHEHASRIYPPGSELILSVGDADWLIALKKAKPASTTKVSEPRASEPAPKSTKESAT